MQKKGKLELTWVGKEERPRLEPRVLVEDPAKSYGRFAPGWDGILPSKKETMSYEIE